MARQLELQRLQPKTRCYETPLLLLHGAWHGAWCWADAMRDFARRGIETYALSLRGHGGSDRPRQFNLCGLDNYLCDLHAAVAAISPTPAIVGHSMGGFILQHYVMNHDLPGAVLLCSAPISGALRFAASYSARHPLAAIKTLLTADGRHLVGKPSLARAAFFRPDIALGPLLLYSALLGSEAARMLFDMSLRLPDPTRNQTPMLAIAAERDQVFTLDEQRATATAYGTELHIVPAATHDLMLDPAWPIAADLIERSIAKW